MSTSTITAKCSCGSSQFDIPRNPISSSTIKCLGCGATGKYGNMKNQTIKLAKGVVEKQLKDAFRKAGLKLR
jgi:hypothetical protein